MNEHEAFIIALTIELLFQLDPAIARAFEERSIARLRQLGVKP